VGGIFEMVSAMFCVMMILSKIYFEFKFAKKYFKDERLKNFNSKDLIEQLAYKGLKDTKITENWAESIKKKHEFQ
jgi:hypothetical protein